MTLARLTLDSGREIRLCEAHVQSTYEGLTEGYPTARLNNAIVGSLAGRATQLLPGAPVCTIDPPRIQQPDATSGALPFGPLETLPAVIVMARFQSLPVEPGADPILTYSRLVVVWFQDEPALPTTGRAPTAISDLHWELLAKDDDV